MEDDKSTKASKIAWSVFLLCISIFGVIHLVGTRLEKDLYGWASELPLERLRNYDSQDASRYSYKDRINKEAHYFICLSNGRQDALPARKLEEIIDILLENDPNALMLGITLPDSYTWEQTASRFTAPLPGLSITFQLDGIHRFNGDIWSHREEIMADYRSRGMNRRVHKVKLNRLKALSVCGEYEGRKNVIYYHYIDFFYNHTRYTLAIESDKRHFVKMPKFKKKALGIIESIEIL